MLVQAPPRVVDSLPPVAEFTGPVYDQVYQEQFSAGETAANIANFPVVQEQVLVQAIPRLVGSLPPVDEFTAYVARRPLPQAKVLWTHLAHARSRTLWVHRVRLCEGCVCVRGRRALLP